MKPTFLLILALMTMPSRAADAPVPPDVARKPHVVKAPFGAERNDEYYWLRDDTRKDPAMLAYLGAENAYADAVMAPLKPVEDRLYGEIVGRIKQDDASVPVRERGWWYYARYETGRDYAIYARRRDADGVDAASILRANAAGDFAGEQVLLDENAMAQGKDYFHVAEFEVSPDNRTMAWTDDDVQDYIERNNVLVNPLVEEGYPSIGCAPCTTKPAEGDDPRSGRWRGRNKIECGLHAS